MNKQHVYLYGAPGSGKSTLGPALAQTLNRTFIDLDEEIVLDCGQTINEIFSLEGERGFRARERSTIESRINSTPSVMALGGGALTNPQTRELVERNGKVLLLKTDRTTLYERLKKSPPNRPLLTVPGQSPEIVLNQLLDQREEHYASFEAQLDTTGNVNDAMILMAQVKLGTFHISSMGNGYDVLVRNNGLSILGDCLHQVGGGNKVAIVSDENVAPIYLKEVMNTIRQAGFEAHETVIKPGEANKTIYTVIQLWDSFVEMRLERGSTVIAMGGGVVGDLAGFAASTFMRGISWIVIPTSLLAMVDASVGGKTGADLPTGKNLVGAFHPPSLVLADPKVLDTLPFDEYRSGIAEVVKHGIIGDDLLFRICQGGWDKISSRIEEVVSRAIGVKVGIIQDDPYEKGKRAILNLGHTIGHALEVASGYHLRHGEAVAIGIARAAKLSVVLGFAEQGLDEIIKETLLRLDLPVTIPVDIDRQKMMEAIKLDKKRSGGKPKFVLPVSIGKVLWGIEIDACERIFDD